MRPTCATCAAWDHTHGSVNGATAGQCRRRAPVPVLAAFMAFQSGEGARRVQWPVTLAGEWCFDHIQAPAPVEPPPSPVRKALPMAPVPDVA